MLVKRQVLWESSTKIQEEARTKLLWLRARASKGCVAVWYQVFGDVPPACPLSSVWLLFCDRGCERVQHEYSVCTQADISRWQMDSTFWSFWREHCVLWGSVLYRLRETETKTTFVGMYPLNCRPSHLTLFVVYVLDQRRGQWSSICSLQGYGGSYECRSVWWLYHISMLLQGSIMWLTRQPRTHVMCYALVCSSVCWCLLYVPCWVWCS